MEINFKFQIWKISKENMYYFRIGFCKNVEINTIESYTRCILLYISENLINFNVTLLES